MKRLFTMILLLCSLAGIAHAQRITRNFQNVSMSDALKYIQQQTGNHKIVFIYNELEDFTVTTHVKNKPVPDAIRQIIGFYPIQMIMGENNDIYVECTHKTEHRLKGMVVDENNLPLPYANVTLLSPADSSMVGGGVTNESGRFVIPNDHGKVIARITYVGYKTEHRLCSRDNVGTIKMQLDNFTLDGVTVKGSKRLTRPTDRGLLANVQGTVLEQFGSVTEMLSHLPLMMGDGTIAGHGKPEIYINNKKVRDASELDRYRADEILSAEIITNPGPEYGQDVTSVIRLKTVKKQGDGLSGNINAAHTQSKMTSDEISVNLNYRLKNGMDFFTRGIVFDFTNYSTSTNNVRMMTSNTWEYNSSSLNRTHCSNYYADLGWNWQINDKHSVGITYTAMNFIGNLKDKTEGDQFVTKDGELVDEFHAISESIMKPRINHVINAYYVGQVGEWKLDFSADYYSNRKEEESTSMTNDDEATASSQTHTKSQLIAEKLTISAPLPKGELTFGEEITNVDRHIMFVQSGFSDDNDIHQLTTTWSLYANYRVPINKFSVNAGVRWQNELNRYELNGERKEEIQPNAHVLIPRTSISYSNNNWYHSLSYRCGRYVPSYNWLSPNVTYEDKYNYSTGDPCLQTLVHHIISWSSKWKWLYTDLTFGHVKGSYTTFSTAVDDITHPGVILKKCVTMPPGNYYVLSLNASPKIGIWQLNYSANLRYTDRDLTPMGITKTFKGIETSFTLDNTLNLPYAWLLNIQAYFSPYYESGFTQKKASGGLNLRISRQFLKDKSLNVALKGSDIFRTNKTNAVYYDGLNYRRDVDSYSDTQRVSIDVSWKFNATRSRYKGGHAGQSERSRL